ncbi:minor tail protein [Mycobacterium phage Megabear]|nr:minor tail protein [Mycobacterium phage Megabear]
MTAPGDRPLSSAEWVRSVEQRLRMRERSLRVGNWVFADIDGVLTAIKPGETFELDGAVERVELTPATRGYVLTPEDVGSAIGYDDEVGDPATSFDELKAWLWDKWYGVVSPTRIPALPWQHLFDGGVELLTDPSFAAAGTLGHDPTVGRQSLGSVKFTANGTDQSRVSNLIEVVPGEKVAAHAWTFFEGVTATPGQNGIRLQVRAYNLQGDTLTLVGAPTMLEGIASPSGESDDHPDEVDGWVQLSGTYTVPSGANRIVIEPMVTSAVTAGDVWFDDGSAKKTPTGMPQAWTIDLPTDLASLWNGVVGTVETLMAQLGLTPTGEFWDDLFDLSDEIAWIQERAAEGAQDALTALGNLSTLATNLLTNPAAVIGTIPQSLVGGLETTLNQIRDVFNGLVVTPVNSVVSAIKDWFDQWFGGGSTNAIPLSQKGAANGVAPLNSSTKIATSYLETDVANGVPKLNSAGKVPTSSLVTNTAGGVPVLDALGKVGNGQMPDLSAVYVPSSAKGAALGVAPLNSESVVPLEYLPAEVGGSGGSGDGRPWVILSLSASQSIPSANAVSKLSGWSQSGTASVTFTDGTNTEWTFNLPGLWHIEVTASFNHASTSTGLLRTQLIRGLVRHSGLELDQETDTRSPAPGLIGTRGKIVTTQMVSDVEINSLPSAGAIRLGEEDVFSVAVSQSTGSSRDVVGLVPYGIGGSHVLCMYLGAV